MSFDNANLHRKLVKNEFEGTPGSHHRHQLLTSLKFYILLKIYTLDYLSYCRALSGALVLKIHLEDGREAL